MFQLITAGLAIGALGSFHCIGMCGPLALSLPVNNNSNFSRFIAALFYNAGRVITYAALGLVFGLMGQSIALFGFQQALSILIGVLILFFLLLGKKFNVSQLPIPWLNRFFQALRKRLGDLYRQRSFSAVFFIGLLNGLLPCGLVYMAIAGAIATGNAFNSVVFMAAFGLGTLPVMWAVAFFGNYLATGIRLKIRKVYPYVMAIMACLLIMRGLGLGIRYVSPKIDAEKKEAVSCGINH